MLVEDLYICLERNSNLGVMVVEAFWHGFKISSGNAIFVVISISKSFFKQKILFTLESQMFENKFQKTLYSYFIMVIFNELLISILYFLNYSDL